MQLKLNIKFSIAFISLHFIMHELHELVHTAVGRLICGCWGQRDFNVWQLCEGCMESHSIAVLAVFAGPLFTFMMIWIGVYILKAASTNQQKAFGFAFIFANNPFARIFTAAMGKGDEVSGLNTLLHNHTLAWVIGLAIVLLLTVFPLYKTFTIINNKKRAGYLLLFLFAPMVLDLVIVFGLMNTLLKKDILSSYWILGCPVLVTLFTTLVTIVFISNRKYIYTLTQ
ncbi:hypothetical protein [Ferruginibacter sp. SUN106]|uniref:hypothetical protein n=1 Tax=Ferruginibacter sp. SUN106 TaxID=2978348 RepID=UPI003D36073B